MKVRIKVNYLSELQFSMLWLQSIRSIMTFLVSIF